MGFLKAGDIISGREGTAFMTIDGRNIEMFYMKEFEASVELEKQDLNTLGSRMKQNKVTGASGSGSMTIYAVTSEFAKIGINYIKTGKLPVITMKVTNDDPNSSVGRQSVLIKDVVLDTIELIKLNVDDEALEQDVDFTFSDAELLETFVEPKLG